MNENLQNRDEKISRIKELTKALNEASSAYYGGMEEIISNYEWDSMFDELLALEKETSFILPDSPTHNTGSNESDGNRDA
nr:NAD-dependent DNA ligase LigA [Lachnospiraceae bacterium]